uniref:diphosphoinositol-polyphosphate diphosphatase n=1 Tax=Romanomermis culicivorax TaxID=13658 RepID=A0A915I9P9_ROMCU
MTMKKNKEHAPSSIRTYDKDGFRRRAACVCVKDEFENEVLLVSRPRQINQWIFPGGGIEPKEDPKHAASREVIEEAGVLGSIIRCLGVFETEHTRTCVYVLQVSCELTEWDDSIKCGRKRMWFTIEDAISALGADHVQLAYLTRLKLSSSKNSVAIAPPIAPLVAHCPNVRRQKNGSNGSAAFKSSQSKNGRATQKPDLGDNNDDDNNDSQISKFSPKNSNMSFNEHELVHSGCCQLSIIIETNDDMNLASTSDFRTLDERISRSDSSLSSQDSVVNNNIVSRDNSFFKRYEATFNNNREKLCDSTTNSIER